MRSLLKSRRRGDNEALKTLEEHIARSGVFDPEWYVEVNPDVRSVVGKGQLTAIRHYLLHGEAEGRNPSAQFDLSFYRRQLAAIGAVSASPLIHYLVFGRAMGWSTQPPQLQDQSADSSKNAKKAEFAFEADLTLYNELQKLIDPDFYRSRYPDIRAAGSDPIQHFMELGWKEGRDPSAKFSTTAYLDLHPDVRAAGVNPLQHYVTLGQGEKRARPTVLDRIENGKLIPRFKRYDVANGVFVVTHSARRTGAPLIALNLVKSIKRQYGIPVWTVVLGDAADLYADFEAASDRITYVPGLAAGAGLSREDALAQAAKELALCGFRHGFSNSIVSAEFLSHLVAEDLGVVSLVHEMPHSIRNFGWREHAAALVQAGQPIVFPCETVRAGFISQFGAPRGKSFILHQPPNIERERIEAVDSGDIAMVREELGLSADDWFVMGCGFADFRKGLDYFVDVAVKVSEALRGRGDNRRAVFAWIGDVDPALSAWFAKDLEARGLEDVVKFVGRRSDVAPYFAAADAFALTSREDPFPTVCIEALCFGAPVVGFAGSGGVVEQVGETGGALAPYGDVAAFADQLVGLLDRPRDEARAGALEAGRRILEVSDYATELLNVAQFQKTRAERLAEQGGGASPLVSVGVPTYRCDRFIEERLASIFEQTVTPSKIFVSDDCSPDATYEAARRLVAFAPVDVDIEQRETNGGSPFLQWRRCLEQLDTPYVWLAESDDSAEPDLIEKLLEPIKAREVYAGTDRPIVLSYANSYVIDVDSNKNNDGHDGYLSTIAPIEDWQSAYVASGDDEIRRHLYLANSIPNVSGCLLAREPALKAVEHCQDFFAAGDWVFYVALCLEGDIAYTPERLNLHRRHGASVIAKLEPRPGFHAERVRVHEFVAEHIDLPPASIEKMLYKQNAEFDRLVLARNPEANRSYLKVLQNRFRDRLSGRRAERKRILVVLPDLHVGGGQMAAVRLAKAWAKHHDVWAFVYNHNSGDGDLTPRIPKSVGLLPKMDKTELHQFVRLAQIEILSSHVWWSDKTAFGVKEENPDLHWLLMMHGCYETLLDKPSIDPWFMPNVRRLLSAADHIAMVSDKNLRVLDELSIDIPPQRIRRVFNGYEPEPEVLKAAAERPLRPARRFVLAGRGIAEKGWLEAAAALEKVNQRLVGEGHEPAELVCLGDGPCIAAMREDARWADQPIRFEGMVDDPMRHMVESDVGLLPSYFSAESTPYAIIEYLFAQLPVICSDIGQCAEMISSENGPAGEVLARSPQGPVSVEALADAMYRLASDPALMARYRENTIAARRKFDMDQIVAQLADFTGYLEIPAGGERPLHAVAE